ncbi:Ig-like domain-containing protein [Caryophanon tenue]|uniref:SbsA Ig-like domain-containing protein n=1 Tax=Caryophanon tenue TaxID=33978 RepID=A0A1C0YDD5_9BACL|nr:Ig-like domain-containing protein [Caryophanon tenue]OCS85161.1 hypothetical protein A6M13_14025 [Caryophanon tenue]
MRKNTAFYVASAALATSIFVANGEVSADSLVPETGYQFLAQQSTLQTFDLSKDAAVRTINFSLPVDEETVKANENIILYDVTAQKFVEVVAKVTSSKTSIEVALAAGTTYEENHEYRLLVGDTIKNLATNAVSLQQAIQFNFKTINVPDVSTNPGEEEPEILDGTVSGTITAITDTTITLNGVAYETDASIAAFIAENKQAFEQAIVEVNVSERKIVEIKALTITQEGAKLQGTTDSHILTNTTVTVAAENITLYAVTMANLFVANNVKQRVNVENSTITGKVQVLEERSMQAVVEEQHATSLVIRFTNSVVVEMLIARVDVKSEISGTSRFTLISVKADTNIFVDPEAVLPRLTIQDGVTNIELNASIAQVDIQTNNNLKVTGSGNFDKVNITSEKKVELDTTGTIQEIAVKNHKATMTVGEAVKIEKVTIPNTVEAKDVIENFDDVKDQIGDKIEQENLEEFIAAKFVRTDTQHVAELSIVGVSEDANISYQHYNNRYSTNDDIPAVGDVLENVFDWTEGEKVPFYFDRDYYVFVTDEAGIITDRYAVHDQFHFEPVTDSQTANTLTLSFSGYTQESTPIDYVNRLYITDGDKSEVVDLTATTFVYNEYGVPSISVDLTQFNGDVAYHIQTLGNYYGFLHNFKTDTKAYLKGLYDFAHNVQINQVNYTEGYAFRYLLGDSNYKLVDYTEADGTVYKMRESLLAQASSVVEQYVHAFREKQFASVTDVQQKVQEINAANSTVITTFNGYLDEMDALFKEDEYSYAQGERLRDDVTIAQIDEIKARIEADTVLTSKDKQEVLSEHSSVVSEYYYSYRRLINDLYDDNQLIKEGVTQETITNLQEVIQAEIPDTYSEKEWWLSRLESMKRELVIQPFKRLENTNVTYQSQRLKTTVTPDEITTAYNAALLLATTDQQKQQVYDAYSQMKYYYVLKELRLLATTPNIETYRLIPLKRDVTEAQIETIFTAFETFEGNYEYSVTSLKENALLSLELVEIFDYVTYVDGYYVLKADVTIEAFLAAYTNLNEQNQHYELRTVLENVLSSGFNSFYRNGVIRDTVTVEQIDEAYETMQSYVTDANYAEIIKREYYDVLYDYYVEKVKVHFVYPDIFSTGHLLHLTEDTTVDQIEAIFASWQPAQDGEIWYFESINRLKEQTLASLEVADALALLKKYYWNYSGVDRLASGDVTDMINVLTTLKETVQNPQAQQWLENEIQQVAQVAFITLKNPNGHSDGTRLREDVTLEEIQEAYETSKALLNDTTLESTYREYMYYYYAKEASTLLVEPFYNAYNMQALKENVTQAQVDEVFSTWTVDEEHMHHYDYRIQELKQMLNNSLLVQPLLSLFKENYQQLEGLERLADGATLTQFNATYELLKATVSEENYQVHSFIDNLVYPLVRGVFEQFRNEESHNALTYLKEDVTLADLQEAYVQLDKLEIPFVQEMYENYQYYYYVQALGALTGIENEMYGPMLFTKETTAASIEELFSTWEEDTTTTYHGERINDMKRYSMLSVSLQDILSLLSEDYTNYYAPVLREGITLSEFMEAYSVALTSTTNETTKEWLNDLLTNTIITKSFRSLENESYSTHNERLRDDVTLEQIQTIYNEIAPFVDENKLENLKSELERYTYYYYYLRELSTLTGITNDMYAPTVFTKEVTVEQIEELFSTWQGDASTTYYAEQITRVQKYSLLSVSLQKLLPLLAEDYQYYNEPLFVEDVSLVDFMTIFNETMDNAPNEEVEEWLTNLLTQSVASKAFNSFDNETYQQEAERLQEDVTLTMIQDTYDALAPYLEDYHAQSLQRTKQYYEYYYYLRDAAKLAPSISTNMYAEYYVLEEGVTLEDIETLFKDFVYDENNPSYPLESIHQLRQKLVRSYSLQGVLVLLKPEYDGQTSPFIDDVTLEQLQQMYTHVNATEDEEAKAYVENLLYAHIDALQQTVLTYSSVKWSSFGPIKSTATIEQIEAVVKQLEQLKVFFATEQLTQAIQHLTNDTLEASVETFNVQDEQVEDVVVSGSPIDLEALESYAAVAEFIVSDGYGYDVLPDVNRESLQVFIEELTQKIAGNEEGNEQYLLLIELANDVLNQPVAFVPFSLA